MPGIGVIPDTNQSLGQTTLVPLRDLEPTSAAAHGRQVSWKTRIQLSKAIFRTASSSKPLASNAAIRFGRPLASLIAAGIVAPSKSDPIATRSIPIRATLHRE